MLEELETKIFRPAAVLPRFARSVHTLAPDQTLGDMLRRIRDDGYARYPVYGPEGFVGLLTTKGISVWLASAIEESDLEAAFEQVTVADLLESDSRRERVAFVGRDALVDDVDRMFDERRPLEAVLVTEHGRLHEQPLAMICPGDLVGSNG